MPADVCFIACPWAFVQPVFTFLFSLQIMIRHSDVSFLHKRIAAIATQSTLIELGVEAKFLPDDLSPLRVRFMSDADGKAITDIKFVDCTAIESKSINRWNFHLVFPAPGKFSLQIEWHGNVITAGAGITAFVETGACSCVSYRVVRLIIAAEGDVARRWTHDWGLCYQSKTSLGAGAFSKVWLTKSLVAKPLIVQGRPVAVKELQDGLSRLTDSDYNKLNMDTEHVKFLSLNGHDEFVKLLDTHRSQASAASCLVFEYCAGRSVEHVLSSARISAADVFNAALRLIRGLKHLKAANFVHCDIAPRNLFLRKTGDFGSLVIGDVGCCEVPDSDGHVVSHHRGESAHKAPEDYFSHSSDIFSAGCVLLGLLFPDRAAAIAADSNYWINFLRNRDSRLELVIGKAVRSTFCFVSGQIARAAELLGCDVQLKDVIVGMVSLDPLARIDLDDALQLLTNPHDVSGKSQFRLSVVNLPVLLRGQIGWTPLPMQKA